MVWTPQDISTFNPARIISGEDGGLISPEDLQVQMATDIHTLASIRTITKGIISRSVTIGSTPVQIILANVDQAFTIINPTPSIGLTSSGVFFQQRRYRLLGTPRQRRLA